MHFYILTRTQSCYVGGLGEEKDEMAEMAEMDDKIRQLTAAMSDKDAELEMLKEAIRVLREKAARDEKEASVNHSEDKDDIAGEKEASINSSDDKDVIIEETVDEQDDITEEAGEKDAAMNHNDGKDDITEEAVE